MRRFRVGVVGCGNISGIYLQSGQRFRNLEVVACADLDGSRAAARAAEYSIPRALSVESILAAPEVEIVINLTVPSAHAAVSIAALQARKHVYVEKPLALSTLEGRAVLDAAVAEFRVGCAPDTFLGGALQTCRGLIDDGAIGQPISATAFMMGHGHEHWHPDPGFYYRRGGGPMFDMGPYYLTALVALMGPVQSVMGEARITFPERTIESEPKRGEKIEVEVPTHVAGLLTFESGAIANVVTSFDVWGHHMPHLEIHGSEGSMQVPDPNGFGGVVLLKRGREKTWTEVPLSHGFTENSRGLGVADMAAAIAGGRPHRASGELGLHVLEIMEAIHLSAERGMRHQLKSRVSKPAPLPVETIDW